MPGQSTAQLTRSENRTIDGTRNNLTHPHWGAAGERLLRLAQSAYADSISAPAGAGRPNPREVSNLICSQQRNIPSSQNLSDYVWAWGQFLDHELDLTTEADPNESLAIHVPSSDTAYAGRIIPFSRSVYDPETGTASANPREQVNQITSYIDASNVYGSSLDRAHSLRTFSGGKLKSNPGPDGPQLPRNEFNLPNAGGNGARLRLAGDVRANEHVVLLSMHTLFVREHNRLCAEIAKGRPNYSDEMIYQRARKVVGALMQVITYNEFLPALLGANAIPPYAGYDVTANAGVSNEFSTAFYRVGHSMLSSHIPVAGSSGLPLRDGFFRPEVVTQQGIEPFLHGLALSKMQQIDTRVVDDVRNFLFGHSAEHKGELLDLAALNIQRGRDHGIADYNSCRAAFGMTPRTSFAEFSSNSYLVNTLSTLYASIDDIDPWVGALAEDHFSGSAVGELIYTALVDQFTRARNGDWYWYENDPQFSVDERRMLHSTTLAAVIERNTGLRNLPANVFIVS